MGFLSPSVTYKKEIASNTSVPNLQKELFSKLLITDISISLFNTAEARSNHRRSHKRHRRKYHRRRANYRHHRRHRRDWRHRRHRRHGGGVVGGLVAGMVIGAAINSSSSRPRCDIVYVRGLRYQDCGGTLRRY